ncbi:hypothetical protein M5K25_017308 [Dendrobium thyrsiflorum]|uniref:Uncharacterized protein n=1 Tax=Dendrobium thyrsiflorum TaxID=117978 RepID=A0ABD0ULY0_DENTH
MTVNRLVDPGFLEGSSKSRSFLDILSGIPSDANFSDPKATSFRVLPSFGSWRRKSSP